MPHLASAVGAASSSAARRAVLWRSRSRTRAFEPARALLNDTNPHLISFYRWLQRGLQIEIELANDETLYYAHRRRFNELIRAGQGGRP